MTTWIHSHLTGCNTKKSETVSLSVSCSFTLSSVNPFGFANIFTFSVENNPENIYINLNTMCAFLADGGNGKVYVIQRHNNQSGKRIASKRLAKLFSLKCDKPTQKIRISPVTTKWTIFNASTLSVASITYSAFAFCLAPKITTAVTMSMFVIFRHFDIVSLCIETMLSVVSRKRHDFRAPFSSSFVLVFFSAEKSFFSKDPSADATISRK